MSKEQQLASITHALIWDCKELWHGQQDAENNAPVMAKRILNNLALLNPPVKEEIEPDFQKNWFVLKYCFESREEAEEFIKASKGRNRFMQFVEKLAYDEIPDNARSARYMEMKAFARQMILEYEREKFYARPSETRMEETK